MQLIHCDGCSKTEPVSTPESDKDIQPLMLQFGGDRRSWEKHDRQYEADICSTCLEQLLSKYFKIPSELDLEIPAFMSRVPVA